MQNTSAIVIEEAQTPAAFEAGALLFLAYANSLHIDLSFQGFEAELQVIDQQYGRPTGALLLAYHQSQAIGCVAIRTLDQETAEMKRMFVQPAYQGLGIGKQLLARILDIAQELDYKRIRLDTLSTMEAALKLYYSFGFYQITPYRFNPIAGAIYMEKNLLLSPNFTY